MLKIGLTGGIGSGKTTAAKRFEELGVRIIDADIIAREVVEPGIPAFNEIVDAFGDGVIDSAGRLNRAALRDVVFAKQELKAQLENILHPRIYDEILRQLDSLSEPYCIVAIPLLAESKRDYPLDRVLVIDLPQPMQLERAAARDQQSTAEVQRIIQSQASREKRLRLADDVVDNSGGICELCDQVDSLHRKYLKLAKGHR